jgi:hypothetical protein
MPELHIAVWNSTLSQKSFVGKVDLFNDWLEYWDRYPSVLVLLEASTNIASAQFLAKSGYEVKGHVGTQKKGGGVDTAQIAKSIVAYHKPGRTRAQVSFEADAATTLRFPGLKQVRATLKLNVTSDNHETLTLWFMHANATDSGGKKAITAVETELAKDSARCTVVFADFNLPIADAVAMQGKDIVIVPPISPSGNPLAFTNWNNKGNVPTKSEKESWGVDPGVAVNKGIGKGDVLDYAIAGTKPTVTAYKNAKDKTMLGEMLNNFDHWPVCYAVEW